jgi:hypothetical protein
VIALWLGHETTRTADAYLDADLALKEKALPVLNLRCPRGRRFA